MFTLLKHTVSSVTSLVGGVGGQVKRKTEVQNGSYVRRTDESSSVEEAVELNGDNGITLSPNKGQGQCIVKLESQSRSVRADTLLESEDWSETLEATHLRQLPSTSTRVSSNGQTSQLTMPPPSHNGYISSDDGDDSSDNYSEDDSEAGPSHKVPVMLDQREDVGRITNMEADYGFGFIDEIYRFDVRFFKSKGLKFGKGDYMKYTAVQINDAASNSIGWTVRDMKPNLSPEEERIQKNSVYKTLRLKVLKVDTQDGKIKCGDGEVVEYVPRKYMPDLLGSQVLVGDWLEVRTKDVKSEGNGNEIHGEFLGTKPVGRNVRKGKITAQYPKYAVIDGDIIIMLPDHCEDGKFPSKGMAVRAEFIESNQTWGHGFNLRAIQVCLRKSNEIERPSWTASNKEILALEKLCEDKEGILVTPARTKFIHAKVGARVEQILCIKNTSTRTHTLCYIRLGNEQSICKFSVNVRKEADNIIQILRTGDEFSVKVTCEPQQLGQTSDFCTFVFDGFRIARELKVRASPLPADDLLLKELKKDKISETTFRRRKGNEKKELERKLEPFTSKDRKQVTGVELIRRPFFLPKMIDGHKFYHAPDDIKEAHKLNDAKLLHAKYPHLQPTEINTELKLTFENYKDVFQVALWFEELHHLNRKEQFSLQDVVLERSGEYFKIPFPDVRDAFPSFNYGDPLRICDRLNPSGNTTNTCIERLESNSIWVRLGEVFNQTYKNEPMNVNFRIGRTAYKRCHFAVENAIDSFGENWLFPSEPLIIKTPRIIFFEDADDQIEVPSPPQPLVELHQLHYPRELPSKPRRSLDKRRRSLRPMESINEGGEEDLTKKVQLRWSNPSLNQEQRDAVKRILRGDARPIPYIIFGPPGTGKTVTVVEAVTQINKLDENSRILVAAPSNAAADLICSYLIQIGNYLPGDFIRLVGFNRMDSNLIPARILPFCKDGDDIEAISKYRIIVCTCNSAGQFFQMDSKLGSLHISHVFIDEAGYCTEPDSLIPTILVSRNTHGQVILAGDPKQLGPTVYDDAAARFCLEQSLLERLMERPIYQKDNTGKYNPILVTKLVRNYRAHPELLQFPSKCFYDGELIPCASEEGTTHLCNLPFLPKKGIPIIFHGFRGEQSKDKDSPSWYNALEVLQVVEYVGKLLDNGCCVEDIGIITPYRKQVDKIRLAISRKNWTLPKVGSVEEFQGGEKKIIILSMVRSTDIESESQFLAKLTFVFNKKRFNVCATRAKALFIVIGNPKLFSINPTWKNFLRHCIKKGVYIGTDLPPFLQDYFRDYNAVPEAVEYEFAAVSEYPDPLPESEQKENDVDSDESDD